MLKTRCYVQLLFLVVTLVGVFIVRANAERWCPFGGVEAVYTYIQEGNMTCSLGISNFYILGVVLLLTLLFKRVFCSYVCPIGTLSEWLRRPGRLVRRKPIAVPEAVDQALSLAKYFVLILVLWFTWRAGELMFRGYDPCYALLSRHGEDIAVTTYVAAGLVVVSSLFLAIPFCRWFCPFAAVMNPVSRLGIFRVTRYEDACTKCGRCSKACPWAISVDQATTVDHARCSNCMSCIEACPEKDKGALTWNSASGAAVGRPQWIIVGAIVLLVSAAVLAAYVAPIPSFVYERGTRPAVVASEVFNVEGVRCRGRATLFAFFLNRNDVYEIDGYVKLEAWPDPGVARVKVIFDPEKTDRQAILQAVTEPLYDQVDNRWLSSPFVVEGY